MDGEAVSNFPSHSSTKSFFRNRCFFDERNLCINASPQTTFHEHQIYKVIKVRTNFFQGPDIKRKTVSIETKQNPR